MLTASMLIGSGVLYVLFSESTLQPWNSGSSSLADPGRNELHSFEEKLALKSELEADVMVKRKDQEKDEAASKIKSQN